MAEEESKSRSNQLQIATEGGSGSNQSSVQVSVTLSVGQPVVSQSATAVTGFQLRPQIIAPFGLRLANNQMSLSPPGSIAQASALPVTGSSGGTLQNVAVSRQGIPIQVSTGQLGIISSRMPQVATFSQSTVIGQPVTLQRLPAKGQTVSVQRLATGTVMPIQPISTTGRPNSPRAISPLGSQVKTGLVSQTVVAQPFAKAPTATIVSVSQAAQHLGLRIPNSAGGQQMTIQRVVSPAVAAQMTGTASGQTFIQRLPSPAVITSQIGGQNSSNILQVSQSGNLHAASPIGTATILSGQQISIQPRPSSVATFISGCATTGITLTVTSVSPVTMQTSLASGMSSQVQGQPVQQIIQPSSFAATQNQVLRPGVPIVLSRTALGLTGRQLHTGTGSHVLQKSLISQGLNSGGQMSVQVSQPAITPILKAQPVQPQLVSSAAASSDQSSVVKVIAQDKETPVGGTVKIAATRVSSSGILSVTNAVNSGIVISPSAVSCTNLNQSSTQSTTDVKLPTVLSVPKVTLTNTSVDKRSVSKLDTANLPKTLAPGDLSLLRPLNPVTLRTVQSAATATVIALTQESSSNISSSVNTTASDMVTKSSSSVVYVSASPALHSVKSSTLNGEKLDNIPSSNNILITSARVSKALESNAQSMTSSPAVDAASKTVLTSSVSTTSTTTTMAVVTPSVTSESASLLTSLKSEEVVVSDTKYYVSVVTTDKSVMETDLAVQSSRESQALDQETAPKEGEVDKSKDIAVKEGEGGEDCGITAGYIDSNLLEWNNNIGTLPGTDMKFKINEFGDLELVDEASILADESNEPMETDTVPLEQEEEEEEEEEDDDQEDKVTGETTENDNQNLSVSDPSELVEREDDPICCCVYCGRYGYKSNFRTSGRFCSQACAGKKNLHRKQMIMSRMVMGMKSKNKKVVSAEVKPVVKDEPDRTSPNGDKGDNFDWDSYLMETKSVGIPRRLFKEPFPTFRNGFKAGMRLEGIDPKHQSLICVLSVAEVQGFRVRLHFDGYSECYDFWVNADSPFIFPVSWAEKNGKKLQPPKNFPTNEVFNWPAYLKQTRSVVAPKNLFVNLPSMMTPSPFRVGMKLEAEDKKNGSVVCVASVADTLDDRILVHFDGWDKVYDYWCDISAPCIHPVGWCKQQGHALSPPPDYAEKGNFSWDEYLNETRSSAVPSRAFKTRSPMGFEAGMKAEVVDKRNPILVRVATIAEVKDHRVLIHFDGWDTIYDFWLDDDNPDIHPPHWCEKTGHPLQAPINKNKLDEKDGFGNCPTEGCKGIGHIKGAKYTGHHSLFGCPYSEANMSKETALTDRLGSSRSEESPGMMLRQDPAGDLKKCPTEGCDGLGHVTGKFTSHHCLSGCPLAEKNLAKLVKPEGGTGRPVGRPGRGRKRKMLGTVQPISEKAFKTEPMESMNEELNSLHASIHESVFQSAAAVQPPPREQPLCWSQHTKLLPGVEEVSGASVPGWSVEDVAGFIMRLTGKEEQAQRFREEQIDGDSFLLLQQSDLMNFLNIKLGPAIKIFNSILVFKGFMEQV